MEIKKFAMTLVPFTEDHFWRRVVGKLVGWYDMGFDRFTYDRHNRLTENESLVLFNMMEKGEIFSGQMTPEAAVISLFSLEAKKIVYVIADKGQVEGAMLTLPAQLYYYLMTSDYYEADPNNLLHSRN